MAVDKNRDQEEAKQLDKELETIDAGRAKALDPQFADKAKAPKKKVKAKNAKAALDDEQPSALKTDHVETETETAATVTTKGKVKAKSAKAAKVVKAGPKAKRAKAEAEEAAKPKAKQSKTKTVQKEARPRSERQGKRYREAYKLVDRDKEYELAEAIKLAQKTASSKFDESIELHINLGVDPKQADQNVRGTVALPHGTGKSQRVAVLADDAGQKQAKAAGADLVGFEKLLKEIEKGNIDFDILIATPEVMPKLGKYGQVLGPRGLMPNPKSGTVSANIAKTVKELKAGRVEFRIDQGGIVHQVIGKASFKSADLIENTKAVLRAIQDARPSTIKGTYLQKLTVAASMGPGIKISPTQVLGEL